MKNTCPQPGCVAAYDLTGQSQGTRFACKTCGQTLVIHREGLRLANSAPVPPPPPLNAARIPANLPLAMPAAGVQAAAVASQVADQMRRVADWPTWMFGAGMFAMLGAIFFPLLDRAKVSRLEAYVVAGDMRQERIAAALARKAEATEAERAKVDSARVAWFNTKNGLEEDLEYAELSRRSYEYWYRWGTLGGFAFLLLGSFGFLDQRQPLMRRIVGCSVLIATSLIVLNALARFSFRLELGPSGF